MFSNAYASIVGGLVGLGLVAAGLGSGAWRKLIFSTQGLFRNCFADNCSNMEPSEVYQKVAAAFLIIALLCIVIGIIAAIYAIRKLQLSMFRTVFVLYLVSAICILVGCASYAGIVMKNNRNVEFGWGFIVPWVGMGVMLIASFAAYKAQ